MKKFNKRIIACAEIDKKAFESASALIGVDKTLNMWDVRNIINYDLRDVNCIVAGFPCQSISSIGNKRGIMNRCLNVECNHSFSPLDLDIEEPGICPLCGSRNVEETPSSLVVYVLLAIKKIKPKLVVIENVANWATSKRFKADFEKIQSKIENVGYNIYWKILNAHDYGSVQNRRRVIMVCVRSDVDNGTFEFPEPYVSVRDIHEILEDCSSVFESTDEEVVIDTKIPPYVIPAITNNIKDIITSNAEMLRLPCKSGWADHVISIKKIATLRASNDTCIVRQVFKDSSGENRYYIKKLTPRERLLATGFTNEDYDKISKINCKTQINHQTGNSICVEMILAVWKELFKSMPYLFEDLRLCSLFQGIGAFERGLDILYNEINEE